MKHVPALLAVGLYLCEEEMGHGVRGTVFVHRPGLCTSGSCWQNFRVERQASGQDLRPWLHRPQAKKRAPGWGSLAPVWLHK